MNAFEEDPQVRIQRALNASKRQELAEKYGATFSRECKLPPAAEAEWLARIEEFERLHENVDQIPLRTFIGSPDVRPVSDIPPSELESELERMLDLLGEHEIVVDFLHDIAAREQYRFIVEELLDEEIDNVRIPGMKLHFMYEEFHPEVEDPYR